MRLLDDLAADLRFTLRLFRKSLGFTCVAIFSLALGIGASSAIFSLIYAVLIDPYPYRSADRMVSPTFSDKQGHHGTMEYTVSDYLDLRKNSKTLEDIILMGDRTFVATRGLPEQVKGTAFSANAFEFMGVPAMLGRTFDPADITSPTDPPKLAVISYAFWHRHFNGDPAVVGKPFELNHQLYNVIGVLPPRFTWRDADVYVPIPLTPDPHLTIEVMTRIRPNTSLAAVSSELQAMTEHFAGQNRKAYPIDFRIQAQRLNDWLLGKFQGTLIILMVAVGFLLLIACGNVSVLLLSRASARQKEIAVRASLGAGRWRVVKQLLTESILLSVTGGLIGVFLAYRGVPAIVALMPEYSVPHEAVIHVNGTVVLFTFAISVLTGLLFGMAPALQLARPDVRDAMQETGRGFAGSAKGGKSRSTLIVLQVALTMVLLIGAGVAIRGFLALLNARLGYDSSHVMTLLLATREGQYQTWDSRRIFFQKVLAKLQNTPGIINAAATITAMPPWIGFETGFDMPGKPPNPTQQTLIGLVGGDYFSTVHIPLLRGRGFSQADMERTADVAVINDEMLHQYWPDDRDPIGLKIHVPALKFEDNPALRTPPGRDQWLQIIGVVATARNRGLIEKSKPAIYIPYGFVLPPGCNFLVRTAGDPHSLINSLRQQIRTIDPEQPVTEALTLDELLSRNARAYPRFSSTLFTIFAVIALLLAATGLFSVVSYVVAQRTHEFGIRMALGAHSMDVLRLVGGLTARLICTGIVIGIGTSVGLSKVTSNYVEGWNPRDPVAFLAVTAIMLGVGLAASWLPARRATAIQPMVALRHQ